MSFSDRLRSPRARSWCARPRAGCGPGSSGPRRRCPGRGPPCPRWRAGGWWRTSALQQVELVDVVVDVGLPVGVGQPIQHRVEHRVVEAVVVAEEVDDLPVLLGVRRPASRGPGGGPASRCRAESRSDISGQTQITWPVDVVLAGRDAPVGGVGDAACRGRSRRRPDRPVPAAGPGRGRGCGGWRSPRGTRAAAATNGPVVPAAARRRSRLARGSTRSTQMLGSPHSSQMLPPVLAAAAGAAAADVHLVEVPAALAVERGRPVR